MTKELPYKILGKDSPYIGKEDDFQKAAIRLLRFKGYNPIHIPNGGNRSAREGAKFKQMGVVAGMPDIMIYETSIAIELKVSKGKLRTNQKEQLKWLSGLGWKCYVCYSIDALEVIIKEMKEGCI